MSDAVSALPSNTTNLFTGGEDSESLEVNENSGKLSKLALEQLSLLRYRKTLDLRFKNITSLENFPNLIDLQTLDLSSNKITSVEHLPDLINLQVLRLNLNKITSLEHFPKLTNLRTLDLSHNKITSVEHLSELTNLCELDLSHNKITSVEHLSQLTNLRRLFLDGNPITDLPDEILKRRGGHLVIYLNGCPLSEDCKKKLRKLNNKHLTLMLGVSVTPIRLTSSTT